MGEASESLDVGVVAEDLSQPTDIAELPDGRLVITQRTGGVVVVGTDGMTTNAGTITVNPDFGEQGLLGVVADPNFASNNTLYFYASVGSDLPNKHKVYKIPLGANNQLDASRDTIISMGLSASSTGNHNGGGLIIFENQLYVSVGDTGHNATPPTNRLGTCLNSANGKILRVALDGSIPEDNPLSAETMVTGCSDWDEDLDDQAPDKRIFSWGFRNPYRFWIDPQTKRMWIGDVGESTREEVSIGAPVDGEVALAGQHFGWPFKEGTTNYSQSWQPQNACMGVTPARECVAPVFDYATTRGASACVIGGLIPEGCGWEAPWTSRYFFGDNSSGRVWTLNVNANRDGIMGAETQVAQTQGVGSFRMGAKGALYIVEVSGGVVSKLTPKGLDPSTCQGNSGGAGGTGGSGGSDGAGVGGTTGGNATGGNAGGGGSPAGGAATTGGSANGGAGMASGGTGQQAGTSSTTGGTGTAGSGVSGSGGGGGGVPAGGKGGTPPTGGTPGTSGASGTSNSGEPSDDGGCGCRVAGTGGRFGALLAAAGGLALLALRRSRKQQRENRR
jgi:glucose/arabinose dehydrogenase